MPKPTITNDYAARLRARVLAAAQQDHHFELLLDDDLREEYAVLAAQLESVKARRHLVALAADDSEYPQLAQAASLADTTRTAVDDTPATGTLGDTPTSPLQHIDDMAAKLTDALASVRAEAVAADALVVVVLRRLTPTRYQAELEKVEAEVRAEARRYRLAVEAAEKAVADGTDPADLDEPEPFDADEQLVRRMGEACLQRGYHRTTAPDGTDLSMTLDEVIDGILGHADLDELRGYALGINRAGAAVDFPRGTSGRPATS